MTRVWFNLICRFYFSHYFPFFRFACAHPDCPDQTKTWSSKYGVYSHWQNDHLESVENFVECTVCQKKCVSTVMLKMHMDVKHYQLKGKTFHCSYCGKIFDSKRLLQNHERAHQEPTGSFSCEFCGYKTYKEKLVAAHVR